MGRRKQKLGRKFISAIWTINKTVFKGIFKGLWFMVSKIGQGIAVSTIFIAEKIENRKSNKKNSGNKKQNKTKNKKIKLPAVFEKHRSAEFSDLKVTNLVNGEFLSFEKRLHQKSMIIAIAGKRGSGKSTLGFRLLENINAKTKRPCFVLGVEQNVLPAWINSVSDVSEVKNNGIVLVDEGALSFSSRNSMSKKNKELGELMAIARHKNLSLILVTQNTGMLDKNVLNLTDAILLKKGSLLQSKMERAAIRKMYETAEESFSKVSKEKQISNFYIFDSDFEGLVSASLPSFWTEKISKNQA